jgi:hypothetical protein
MDLEERLMIGLTVITVVVFAVLIGYGGFVVMPRHYTQILQCEQAGGVAVTDSGRFRLCLSADVVIKLEESVDAN